MQEAGRWQSPLPRFSLPLFPPSPLFLREAFSYPLVQAPEPQPQGDQQQAE
jgi:hypothetical protein